MSRKSENRRQISGFRVLGVLLSRPGRGRPSGSVEIWSPPIVPYCTRKGGRQLLHFWRLKNRKSGCFRVSSSESDFYVTFLKKSLEKRFFVTFFEKVIIFSFFHRQKHEIGGVFAFYSVSKRDIYSPAFSCTVRYDGRGPYFKVARFPTPHSRNMKIGVFSWSERAKMMVSGVKRPF